MKNLIIFALLLCASTAFAQKDTTGLNIPLVNQTVVYEKVYDVPNSPQNLLYSNARTWFASTHPDAGKTQPTVRDSILSRVAGKATFSVNSSTNVLWQKIYLTFVYNFTVQIDCKDNKYRLRIYNIQYGEANTPIEAMLQSLSKSKSLDLGDGFTLSKSDLRQRLQPFSGVINDLLADVNKKMVDRNDF